MVLLLAVGVGLTGAPARAQVGFPGVSAAKAKIGAVGPVDVNTADEATLQTLPGVGPALAKQIVAGRPFSSVEELSRVKGIGPAKLAALRGAVTVGGSTLPTAAPSAAHPSLPNVPLPKVPEAPTRPEIPAVPGVPRMAAPAMPAAAVPPGTPAGAGAPGLATARQAARTAAKLPAGVKVNLNTASEADLEMLPGIGPVKAKAIIAGRPYAKPEDVMKVSGIKQGIFNKIKDAVTVQ